MSASDVMTGADRYRAARGEVKIDEVKIEGLREAPPTSRNNPTATSDAMGSADRYRGDRGARGEENTKALSEAPPTLRPLPRGTYPYPDQDNLVRKQAWFTVLMFTAYVPCQMQRYSDIAGHRVYQNRDHKLQLHPNEFTNPEHIDMEFVHTMQNNAFVSALEREMDNEGGNPHEAAAMRRWVDGGGIEGIHHMVISLLCGISYVILHTVVSDSDACPSGYAYVASILRCLFEWTLRCRTRGKRAKPCTVA